MTAFRRLLHWLAGFLPLRVIDAETARPGVEAPLFERYLVCRLPGGGAVYLHHYLRSDPDRGCHDHPWPWAVALPLAGGYEEERIVRKGWRGKPVIRRTRRRPGLLYVLTGRDFHRVLTPPGRTSWSLFAHGGKCKGWGFWRPDPDELVWRYHPWPGSDALNAADELAWARHAPTGRQVDADPHLTRARP